MIRFQSLSRGVELGVGSIFQNGALARQGAQLRTTGKQQGLLKYAEGAAAFDLSSQKQPLPAELECACVLEGGMWVCVNM